MSANPTQPATDGIDPEQPTVDALYQELQTMKAELEDVRAEKRELKRDYRAVKRECETLEGRVDELETRVDRSETGEKTDEADENIDEGKENINAEEATDSTAVDSQDDRIEWRGEDKHIENLWIDDIPVGKIVHNAREASKENAKAIDQLKDEYRDVDPSDRVTDEYTPIERMAALGEEITESITDRRALTIFEQFIVDQNWGATTMNGRVLKSGPDRVKTLLNTAREDDRVTDWKQVYRAYERLEELSDGYIEYRPDGKRGKMLVLEDPLPSMKTPADRSGDDSLTASSAGA